MRESREQRELVSQLLGMLSPAPHKRRRRAVTRQRLRHAMHDPGKVCGWRIPSDLEYRLRLVADHFGITWGQLSRAILAEWISFHAPYRPRGETEVTEALEGQKHPIRRMPLFDIRTRKGFSIARLAEFAGRGVSEATIRTLERGGPGLNHVTLSQVLKVADALGVAVCDLVPVFKHSPRAWYKRAAAVRAGEDAVAKGVEVAERPIEGGNG